MEVIYVSVKTKGKFEIDMCSGSIFGKMMLFTLPLMASSLLQLLFNAADIVVVGQFVGDNAMGAVGSNGALINLLTNFFMGLSVGANVLVARYFAACKNKDLHDTVHTAMFISILSGFFLTIIGVICAKQLLILMDTPGEILGLATIYLRIYFLGMTAMMVYNFGAAILRAIGDTQRPLYFLLFSGIINVILNIIFVVFLRMSVAGVGLATVISQIISATLILRCLIQEQGEIHLEIKELRIHKEKFFQILRIGLPASFQGIIFSFSNVIIQSSVNSFGKVVVAGNSAASNLEGFVYVAMNAFHQTAVCFTSQNMGAGKKERIPKILVRVELSVIVVGLVLGNLLVLFGKPLLGFYTSEPAVVQAGLNRLNVISRTYFLCGMMDVMVGMLRGLGYSIMPMIVSLIGACGLRLLWIFTFFRTPQFHNITSLYLTYTISWIITVMVHIICFIIVWNRFISRKTSL